MREIGSQNLPAADRGMITSQMLRSRGDDLAAKQSFGSIAKVGAGGVEA